MKNCIVSAGLLLALASGAAQAVVTLGNGDTLNVGSLLSPGSDRQFIVGDKLFTVESFSNSAINPPASSFTIAGFIAGGGPGPLPNVGFDLLGPFGDGTPGDGVVHEWNLQYTVEILPQYIPYGYAITDNVLTFNGSSSGDGSFARVDETVFDFFGNTLLGNKSVFDIAGPPRETRLQDSLVWGAPGYTKLEINKDVKMFAAHVSDTATASFIRQEFSQIPTPGAASLLGLAGFLAARRRR